MNKIKHEEYIAFKCGECGIINIFPKNKADGNRCIECDGFIIPVGNARVHKKNMTSMTIGISVDTTQLDEALEKAEKLNKNIKEAIENQVSLLR